MFQLSIFDTVSKKKRKALQDFGLNETTHSLLANKSIHEIKDLLQSSDATTKGQLFEKVMAHIFHMNGYFVQVTAGKNDMGADLILVDKENPDKVALIVQLKNTKHSLTKDDVRSELIKFEQESAPHYKCQFFAIYSIGGFVSAANEFSRFNINLCSWSEIEALILSMSDTPPTTPSILLKPHNNAAYSALNAALEKQNRAAIVQATGTGKSFIAAQFISNNLSKKGVLVAPTHYIIDQFKDTFGWRVQNVQFLTYSKLAHMNENEIKNIRPDYIIIDEFHRAGADEWGASIDLFLKYNHSKPVIGLSATPIRFLDGNRDMGKELFNNNLAHKLELPDAIARRILKTPKFISALFSVDNDCKKIESEIADSKASNEIKTQQRELLKQYKIDWKNSGGVSSIIKKHLNSYGKMLVFCESILHLKKMNLVVSEWFLDAFGDVPGMFNVHSDRTRSENGEELTRFMSANGNKKWNLLFSVDMLNEGVHIDGIEGVILLRETASPRIFFQQIGRALAVSQNEEPIIFDFVSNSQSLKNNDISKDINNAIKREDVERSSAGLAKSAVSFSIEDYTQDFLNVLSEIRYNINDWSASFELYVEFKNKFGREPKQSEEFKRKNLGEWVSSQRRFHKTKRLSQDRIERLNATGFAWDPWEAEWEECFDAYKVFKQLNNREPKRSEEFKRKNLGMWCSNQRRSFKTEKLSQDKLERLNEMGFEWDPLEAEWGEMLEAYIIFKQLNNREPKQNEEFKRKNLGIWCNTQRRSFKKKKLVQEKISRLNDIGFEWRHR